jgi:DNA invertase Pin-like site-specific DNA recombinase
MNGIIYCRVSSKEQVEGTSLESQESACREYAHRNQIEVLRVFIEKGESAKFADRTQLLELMEFCRDRRNGVTNLLVWKVDRLARNVGDHFNIKAILLKQGVQVVSVTEPIDANPEGKLLETILAGFAQFDNDLRAARTVQGMRRKIQEGIFPWSPPLGYKGVSQPGTKKTLPDEPDQPVFGMLQKAWQEYATGAYTKAEILRLLSARGGSTKNGAPISKQSIDNMLRDPFYAGIIRDPWSGEVHSGQHMPLISKETFARIQEVISRRNRSIRHERLRPEFPLRVFARCSNCEHYLTGALSRGRSKYYPYYRCFSASCSGPTNYKAEALHEEFTQFLISMAPDRSAIRKIRDAVATASRERTKSNDRLHEKQKLERQRLQHQDRQLIQMRMDQLLTNDEFLSHKAILMNRLRELEAVELSEPTGANNIEDQLDEICEPLTRLDATWEEISPALKQRFQRLILPAGFAVGRIGTAQRGCLFSTFLRSEDSKSTLVPLAGQIWNPLIADIRAFAALFLEKRDQERAA